MKNFLVIPLSLLLFVLFSFSIGCVSMPGTVISYESESCMTKEITTEPAFVCKEGFGDCLIKFGLFRRSTMPENQIILTVMVDGIHTFTEPSLLFNIDGEIIKFVSINAVEDSATTEEAYISSTYVPGTSATHLPIPRYSKRYYLIYRAFLKKILNAQRVEVRINLSKTYYEGIFSQNKTYTARPAFRDFYERVYGNLKQ